MEVQIIGEVTETCLLCDSVLISHKDNVLKFDFESDDKARESEDYIKRIGGKTVHLDRIIYVTNPEDFTVICK